MAQPFVLEDNSAAELLAMRPPDLWREWFQGLTQARLRSLAGPELGGRDAVGLCPSCGATWPAHQGVPLLVCFHCHARIKDRDAEPRPLEPVEVKLGDLVGCEAADQDPTP